MNKTAATAAVLLTLLCVSFPSAVSRAEEAATVLRAYGDLTELKELGNRIDEIESLSYILFGVGGETVYDCTEHAEEVAVFLSELEPGEELNFEAEDCDEFFEFVFSDGTQLVFWFNDNNFCTRDETGAHTIYQVEDFESFDIREFADTQE